MLSFYAGSKIQPLAHFARNFPENLAIDLADFPFPPCPPTYPVLCRARPSLFIPGLCSAFGTFLVRQYMLGLSSELEESAMMDGASDVGIFIHVALPLSRPVLVALAILHFLGAWQGFLGPLIVTYSEKMRVAPLALFLPSQVLRVAASRRKFAGSSSCVNSSMAKCRRPERAASCR